MSFSALSTTASSPPTPSHSSPTRPSRLISGASMASIEKPEPASSESSLEGPHADTHSRAPSPALNSDQQPNSIQEHAPTPAPPPPASTASPFAIPHPKRFNSVNINKKFLQKNSSSSAVAVVASLTTAAKTGSPTRTSSLSSSVDSLIAPTSSPCSTALCFPLKARHSQAHLDSPAVRNSRSRLVPPILRRPASLHHPVRLVERTTPTTNCTHSCGAPVPSCRQSHTTSAT